MKQFLENILHQQIEVKRYADTNKLPLFFQGNYNLFDLTINGQNCILAEPKTEQGLVLLRKQQRRLELLTARYCVLYLKKLESYSRDKMLEEGIPFIWENHQIYMPFLGLLLKQNETRELKPCNKISFLTQKLLLTALYDQWQNVNVTKAASLLNVTKMSITRCFDEIESFELPLLHKNGKARLLSCCADKRKTWEMIESYMRNPLLQEFHLKESISQNLLKSGISALCEYSLLDDNKYPTYAITKSQLADLDIKNMMQVPKNELPGCVVQELGYTINYRNRGSIDPLTVSMLTKELQEDPRADKANDKMLEEYVW